MWLLDEASDHFPLLVARVDRRSDLIHLEEPPVGKKAILKKSVSD